MSAVQGPMPCISISAACAIVGFAFADVIEIELALGDGVGDRLDRADLGGGQAEPPQPVGARAAERVVMERIEGACSRPQIARALAVENCWPQMMRARPGNPPSPRRSAGSPAFSRTGTRRGSALTSCASGGGEVGLGVEELDHSSLCHGLESGHP